MTFVFQLQAHKKTALLNKKGKWFLPLGSTPTTHILKPQMGVLSNGLDLTNSVENEFYCLKLLEIFGFNVNQVTMQTFGKTKALVIERFDRYWSSSSQLLRIPQEDCCQALGIPPSIKYQNRGGPNIKQLLELLKGSDNAEQDRSTLLKAQIYFWLISATDRHAKNFSIFIGQGGTYRLTPLYDVLTGELLATKVASFQY